MEKNPLNICTAFKNQNRLSSLKTLNRRITSKIKDQEEEKEKENQNKTQTLFYKVISNLYLTKKFISVLKNLTSFRNPKWLNKQHFQMMNDLAFDYKNYQKMKKSMGLKEKKHETEKKSNKKFKFLKEKIKAFANAIDQILPIFDPSKKFSIFWDCLVLISIFFFFIVIPLDLAFLKKVEQISGLTFMKTACLYIFLLDLFKSSNSSYYSKGVLQKNRKKIIFYYLKSDFITDLLTLIPLFLHHFNIWQEKDSSGDIVQLFFFLKINRFMEISKKLGELIFIDKTIQNLVSLANLVIRIMIIAHIFTCIWYVVGNITYYPTNWIIKNQLSDAEWYKQYLYGYYFVCVTMITVGFGDISPSNPAEVLFTIVFIFIACGIFAYSLNSIGIIVGEIWKRQNEFSKDINIINEFMREKNIHFDLKMRVRKYLEYIWNEEKLEEVEQQVKLIFFFLIIWI